MQERLQKIISGAGLASRRAAEQMLRDGRVTVNGQTAQLGQSADPEEDIIRVDGERLPRKKSRTYVMLNKPKGYVTTMHDEEGRPTVAELVQVPGRRLYPVGRLDMYSEGLLILTDDGEAANRLMHPSHRVEKTYIVDVVGEDLWSAVRQMRREMDIDGVKIRAIDVQLIRSGGGRGQLSVTIGEGRNRQVRKMCDLCGLKVQRLVRISEGALELGDLPTGTWRYLTPEEVRYVTEQA
ncbi:MAG: rRNA pseudouridine synthase [Oscillospiraceae bacterium]|nr:rRNA pseudouridine synthase [Oscillospiraceae bacterium]MDD6503406.1 pseudouridine synthase [Oscillospiraceae bacterium]MDY4105615.1 pseudouridine synthase [Oscillospiraceae bacterium]